MFRPKSEAVQVGVQKVLIPCRNGTNFGENRQLYFDIPRNIGFANLKNARILTSIRCDNTATIITMKSDIFVLCFVS